MNYLQINHEIEKLNLKWQEYDFGDTLYTKIPAMLLSQQTNIISDCQTKKYKIQFCKDGNALIFRETEQISLIEKAVRNLLKVYLSFKRNRRSDKTKPQVSNH